MPDTPDGREAFVDVAGKRMHYTRLGAGFSGAPILFLHEGLGSVERWRTFPAEVVAATQHPGLVYSRHGNGWSDHVNEGREPDYMHGEALQVLPELVSRLLGALPILLGHSDGASIALIYAGSGYPVSGLVLIAPHVFVEPLALESIASTRQEFLDSDMPERMAKYHLHPEKTFLRWADA
ncbi:MAG: alpha/beta fold hydrolase, partial [Acidimicrobiia bacterium]